MTRYTIEWDHHLERANGADPEFVQWMSEHELDLDADTVEVPNELASRFEAMLDEESAVLSFTRRRDRYQGAEAEDVKRFRALQDAGDPDEWPEFGFGVVEEVAFAAALYDTDPANQGADPYALRLPAVQQRYRERAREVLAQVALNHGIRVGLPDSPSEEERR